MAFRSPPLRDRFLFSTEEECLTALPDAPEQLIVAIERFLSVSRHLAPSLAGRSGYFNAYGRVYADMGHIELAAMECDDPYQLAAVVEQQHTLAAQAVAEMEAEGMRFVLANNNHSGLLRSGCPVWGAHENYLTEKHPSEFTDRILPFLVTRLFAGSGGIWFPSGDFLAGVRPTCMELITGGDTTSCRAIHSTAREEHHMGPEPDAFRYHQILGDGHRSHFNLALQFGATALALKAVQYDRQLPGELDQLGRFPPPKANWVGLLRETNVVAKAGQPLAIDPLVVATQRIYLRAARRFVRSLDRAAAWIPRMLDDWGDSLDAIDRLDRRWLAARLDSFAKYELYSNFLKEAGTSWKHLQGNMELFHRLAILDHSYHEFCNPTSVFRQMERAGVLDHRVGQLGAPGSEKRAYVPDTTTRARARAVFISNHHDQPRLVIDWSTVQDMEEGRARTLYRPFAKAYGPWRDNRPESRPDPSMWSLLRSVI